MFKTNWHFKNLCNYYLSVLLLIGTAATANAQKTTTVGDGWAANSVNTVIFRKNALVTFGDTQYTAYYNAQQYVVLAKRKLGTANWEVKVTAFKGDAKDAHKTICIMVDGEGYLHMAWGHHNQPLNYCHSVKPGSVELTSRLPMTGLKENKVTYPEFYKMPDGDVLFFYRDGASGNGNLILNRYHCKTKTWTQIQDNLIDGEGQRSAYWQMAIDAKGTLHLSWVWRESPDVASNHDMAYACSKDGGVTWQKSSGQKYQLPINAANAEYACIIPQKSELINQTAMFADAAGNPYIATYWRDAGQSIPQYHIIYQTGHGWKVNNLTFRKTAFSISGGGTKQIPISRPQIIAWPNSTAMAAALIFRDEERGSKVSIAISQNIQQNNWELKDLTDTSVGSWEPTYDAELWKNKKILNLFIQKTVQVDGEGQADMPAQPVQVLEWKPSIKK
jgi:hypothetical protein